MHWAFSGISGGLGSCKYNRTALFREIVVCRHQSELVPNVLYFGEIYRYAGKLSTFVKVADS
jgi:hypothetical protein